MSARERNRLEALARVLEQRLAQRDAAERLAASPETIDARGTAPEATPPSW